jgi:glyoxylase-like metal-dependent hydrolase (beta-lactamase superfamily II)
MEIASFFDPGTGTLTYLVYAPSEGVGVVIDPVAEFDPASGALTHARAEEVGAFIDARSLSIPWVLETHAHADHLSAMPWFKERYGARSVIGRQISEVQATFRDVFNLGHDFPVDGRPFDHLVDDGEIVEAGPLRIEVLHTPGHTPACLSYRIGDAVFVGDTLFQPDYGTARCDFPGGSAAVLYDSIQRLYALPDATRLFTCHDYQPGGRKLRFESTVAEQKGGNVQLDGKTGRDAFVAFREKRDATLSMPALILPSIQANIRAGELPAPESNGLSYFKIPINAFEEPR